VLVATPDRLRDLYRQNAGSSLISCRFWFLDEADRIGSTSVLQMKTDRSAPCQTAADAAVLRDLFQRGSALFWRAAGASLADRYQPAEHCSQIRLRQWIIPVERSARLNSSSTCFCAIREQWGQVLVFAKPGKTAFDQ